MTHAKFKELNKALPETERDWIDAIPEVLGEKWKKKGLREGRAEGRIIGRAEGRAEGLEAGRMEEKRLLAIKTIQKFPEWTDAEIAEFVGVSLELVQQIRAEIADNR